MSNIYEIIFCYVTDHLKKPLDDYVAKLPKVSLLRSEERIGLIRARLMGYEEARGDVLLFLDSHCEVTHGRSNDHIINPEGKSYNEKRCTVFVSVVLYSH